MDFTSGTMTVITVVVAVIIIVALLAFVASRVRRVPPNTALIVVGRDGGKDGSSVESPQKVIIGGRTFVWPILQEGFMLSLEQRQTGVEVQAPDSNYIKTGVKATVNFKVTGTEDGVRKAAQRYLKQQEQLPTIVQQSLEGSLRGLIGQKKVDDLVKDFAGLAAKAIGETKDELAELGLQIETLNIRDIETPGSTYLQDRGRAEAATARQLAEVSEAEADRIAALAKIENEQLTNERQLELDLRKASIKAETDTAQAKAAAAGELARAEQEALVAEQERIATAAQAEVAEQKLNIEVRKPAEADAYAQVQKANADRDSKNAEVEAQVFQRTKTAEAAKVAAENEAASVEAAGKAAAEVVRVRGVADGDAIKAKGLAQAEVTQKLAEAQNKLDQSGLAALVVEKLPEMAQAFASSYAGIDNFTVISPDGASAVTKEVASNMAGLPEMVKATTGLDLTALITGAVTGQAAGAAAARQAPARPVAAKAPKASSQDGSAN
ncbi:flotillin (plasmid) [Frondihabitans sucicola]|uniref:Flotillin n=1 Tax=Frondihabitans sucicola TaxID=1268041 RepID=A0ABN6Y5M6_9MICO|nr:SPFH domain-containing protein [Frondihabitans sucicola]BDZ52630.1 flotillin [Frondihabitans sucicola]